MNTNYPNARAVNEFIARLMQEPYFLDGTLMMYADVPVKCLRYAPDYCDERENLWSAPEKYRYEAFDFVVCQGNTVAACICFNYSRENAVLKELLGGYLSGLDCIAHEADSLDSYALEEFYPFAAQRLGELAQEGTCCTDYALDREELTVDLRQLKRGGLLEESGYGAVYRRDCGIFYQCYIEEDGTLCQEPVTCHKVFPEQIAAFSWQPERNEDLEQLQNLLEMPLRDFCGRNIERLIEVQETLGAFGGILEGFPYITMSSSYRDFLYAYAECHTNPKAYPSKKAVWIVMARLERVLAQAIRDRDFPFFQIPLHRYYAAAANLAGCYYPVWLYRNMIRPHLCNRAEEDFTMSRFAGYSHAHLTNLMVEPICVPGTLERAVGVFDTASQCRGSD